MKFFSLESVDWLKYYFFRAVESSVCTEEIHIFLWKKKYDVIYIFFVRKKIIVRENCLLSADTFHRIVHFCKISLIYRYIFLSTFTGFYFLNNNLDASASLLLDHTHAYHRNPLVQSTMILITVKLFIAFSILNTYNLEVLFKMFFTWRIIFSNDESWPSLAYE